MLKFLSRFFKKSAAVKTLGKSRIKKIESLINKKISHPEIFLEALTHSSIVDDKKFKLSYERLEFLGDAILGFLAGESLFEKFPGKNEGFLTKSRSNLVNKNNLFEAAVRIDLLNLIFIGKEISVNNHSGIKTILADGFESFVGAIYIDSGMEQTKKFIDEYLLEPSYDLGIHLSDINYKSQLLEFTQAYRIPPPKYFVVDEKGPEHERIFQIEVRINDHVWGIGEGRSKKAAEQEASKSALKNLTHERYSDHINYSE